MVSDMLFEIAVLVFLFLAIGIGLTVYEFRTFIDPDKNKKREEK